MSNHNPRYNKTTADSDRQQNDTTEDLAAYVSENHDLLSRVLARGNPEAQGYALAAIANGGSIGDIEEIQQILEEIKEEKRG
jgi:hypothetical protein